jgi:hypothetical protein
VYVGQIADATVRKDRDLQLFPAQRQRPRRNRQPQTLRWTRRAAPDQRNDVEVRLTDKLLILLLGSAVNGQDLTQNVSVSIALVSTPGAVDPHRAAGILQRSRQVQRVLNTG